MSGVGLWVCSVDLDLEPQGCRLRGLGVEGLVQDSIVTRLEGRELAQLKV